MATPQAEQLKRDLAQFASRLAACGTVAEMRRLYSMFADLTGKPSGVAWTEADAGGVPGIWADAEGEAADRVLLYLHGGGYVLGDAHSYKSLAGHLAKAVGCRVLCPDYRLAPEHPFPAAITDATKVHAWLLGEGYRPERLAIAGDSAGGGLALATLLALRDAGTSLPVAAAALLSPWADLEAAGESMASNTGRDVLIQRPMMLGLAAMLLAGHAARAPLASPVHADFTGLPPLCIQAGDHETLLDDARRVARAAQRAGVETHLEEFPEMQHVFQVGAGRVPEADEAIAKIGAFLRPRLGL